MFHPVLARELPEVCLTLWSCVSRSPEGVATERQAALAARGARRWIPPQRGMRSHMPAAGGHEVAF